MIARYTTSKSAMMSVKGLIKAVAPTIYGLESNLEKLDSDSYGNHYLTINWERSWAVSAALSFKLRFTGQEESKEGKINLFEYDIEVSWSSTNRSPAAARAAIALYSQVTDLAAQIETLCDGAGYIGDAQP